MVYAPSTLPGVTVIDDSPQVQAHLQVVKGQVSKSVSDA